MTGLHLTPLTTPCKIGRVANELAGQGHRVGFLRQPRVWDFSTDGLRGEGHGR